jgi:hypothetical protein
VRRVLEELPARLFRLQDALLALDAKIVVDAASPCDELDELCRPVGVQLVGDEDPARAGIAVDGLVDVGHEVDLCSCRSDRWTHHFARHHIEVRHQRQGAVPDILELDALDEAGPNGLGLVQSFERLHARFLIGTHHVRALRRKLRSIPIRVTDLLDVGLVLLRRLALTLRCQPILALVRSQVRLTKERSMCLGEMLWTMPLLMASRASPTSAVTGGRSRHFKGLGKKLALHFEASRRRARRLGGS